MKRLSLPISFLAVLALTACGTLTLPDGGASESSSTASMEDSEKLANPNRFFLNSIAKMFTNPTRGTEINFASDAFISSGITLPWYETETSFNFDIAGVLAINQDQGFQEAQLNLAIHRFALATSFAGESFSSSDELVYENETATVYFDQTNMYVDLSPGATDIPQFLFPSSNRVFPTQFQSPFDFANAFGTFTPQISEADIDAWVALMLPMVDGLTLLNKSLNGVNLTVTYEITQDDLFAIFERMYLGTATRDSLSDEDNLILDAWLEEIVQSYTLNRFVLSLTLNTLTNMITDVFVDIDVNYLGQFTISIQEYDPENPEADEYGYIITGTYVLEWNYRYDIFFQGSFTFLESPILLVAPINKEEYEIIVLTLEDPNLV